MWGCEMTESGILKSDSLLLLDALQLAPRAPWAKIGEALGTTAVTAAKRWARLSEAGLAWVTAAPAMAVPSSQCLAYVEITCYPEHRQKVANVIAAHSLAVSVELTTGSADILVTVAAADWKIMSHYLLTRLDQVEHVLSSRARIATRIYHEGSGWRLRELPVPAVSALERLVAIERSAGVYVPPARLSNATRTMLIRLSTDGRTSIAELAGCSGLSQTTARRRLADVLKARIVMVRTDVSRHAVGRPVQVDFAANAPVETLNETAQTLSRFRELRLTTTTTGAQNLMFTAWLRTVEDVQRLELAIALRMPQIEIVDRLIVLRTIKRMGRLVDEFDRSVGGVAINLWEDSELHAPAAPGA